MANDLDDLAAGLRNAAGRIGADAAKVVRKTATDIERTAKRLVPVDTGELRTSITVEYEGDGRFANMGASVGPTADYAAHVEYGTSQHAPQPFMRPAANRHRPEFIAAMEALGARIL